MSCGVDWRLSSDPGLLWLWCRLAAITPIRPLAWEPPYATCAAQEKPPPKKINKLFHLKPWFHLLTYFL